jgi:signal transduction histidine kinase/CheY-like chemotaxis protein
VVKKDSSIQSVFSMIEVGEEANVVYTEIVEATYSINSVQAVSLYLPSKFNLSCGELVSSVGSPILTPDPSEYVKTDRNSYGNYRSSSDKLQYMVPMISLGIEFGALIVRSETPLTQNDLETITLLSWCCSNVYDQHQKARTLQNFIDRLQILNSLNQLIAANAGLKRIMKGAVRESAYRFSANVVIAYLIHNDSNSVEMHGSFGLPNDLAPLNLPKDFGIIGRVLRTGSHISIPEITDFEQEGIEFLKELGLKSIIASGLEVRGSPLGVLILGYKSPYSMDNHEALQLEELCRGTGVAISTALNQERIKGYTEHLEELVEKRTEDLAIQTERAHEANVAKSRFLANMSHELRTPLTAIVGYAGILMDGLFGELNERQIDALNSVVRSSEHLKNLIDDVLNLARIESGKEEPEPTEISIVEMCYQIHKLMMQTAMQKKILFPQPIIPENITTKNIYADQKHIHQVLINLLSNAIKYTPDRGKVWMSFEEIEGFFIINVHDTGVGISADKKAKLFERFERGDDPYSKSQEGTGIGLNLTKRLVMINGGEIWCNSEQDSGSVFSIKIPVLNKENSIIKNLILNDEEICTVRLDGLKILVVEDNTETLKLIEIILKNAGANAFMVKSVADALDFLNTKDSPDMIITDLAMPNESGLSLIEKVRTKKLVDSNVPIVVLSSCAFEEDKNHAMESGATFFISKPFRPKEVVSTLRNLTISAAMNTTLR